MDWRVILFAVLAIAVAIVRVVEMVSAVSILGDVADMIGRIGRGRGRGPGVGGHTTSPATGILGSRRAVVARRIAILGAALIGVGILALLCIGDGKQVSPAGQGGLTSDLYGAICAAAILALIAGAAVLLIGISELTSLSRELGGPDDRRDE